MINPHAHHIIFKTGNGEAQQELVKEAQEILRSYGIDPILGKENIVWAPNAVKGQHSVDSLKTIVEELRLISELGGTYYDIVEILHTQGRVASLR